ncbi:hypothetical protein SLNSH_08990 [Alsobacter soli]|uniref:Uncharacterized protein n=1 Tax=Alsobacter soli TaxID=2109933 RepID=A0A2T1HUM3_9HYPH|nr:hypothetical protein [Alsobacter soli]PSC05328.1 hypothetical protein SLNSH_08990 [Alsobacter soli]
MNPGLATAASAAAIILCASAASAGGFPTFEVNGLPITPHQAALLGLPNMEEQVGAFVPTVNGMPASPHQVAVLAPRRPAVAKAAPTTRDGVVSVKLVIPLEGREPVGEH